MTGDIVTRFLTSLRKIEPPTGDVFTRDGPHLESDLSEVPSIGIDAWFYRADFERVLREFVTAEKEAS